MPARKKATGKKAASAAPRPPKGRVTRAAPKGAAARAPGQGKKAAGKPPAAGSKQLSGAALVLAKKAEAAREKTRGWDAGGERGKRIGPGRERPTRPSDAARRAGTSR